MFKLILPRDYLILLCPRGFSGFDLLLYSNSMKQSTPPEKSSYIFDAILPLRVSTLETTMLRFLVQ